MDNGEKMKFSLKTHIADVRYPMMTFVILGCIYFPADGLMTSTFGDYL